MDAAAMLQTMQRGSAAAGLLLDPQRPRPIAWAGCSALTAPRACTDHQSNASSIHTGVPERHRPMPTPQTGAQARRQQAAASAITGECIGLRRWTQERLQAAQIAGTPLFRLPALSPHFLRRPRSAAHA